jgi:hypothetical protein
MANVDEKSGTASFMEGAIDMIKRWLRPVKRWVSDFFKWLGDHMRQQNDEPITDGGDSWRTGLKFFAWLFCGAAVCAMGLIGWKLWLRRGKATEAVSQPQLIIPDLNAEDVAADQLPEDAWMGLAREMIEKGDLRFALRAFYLAALAHLSERHVISIARYKSNYDYLRELRRRRPTQGELIATFSDTVGSFERAWYGMHEVTIEVLNQSQINLERIRES